MRIAKRGRQVPDVQTPANTDKGKDVLVEAPKRRRTRTAQCIISALQAGKEKKNNTSFHRDKLIVFFLYFF